MVIRGGGPIYSPIFPLLYPLHENPSFYPALAPFSSFQITTSFLSSFSYHHHPLSSFSFCLITNINIISAPLLFNSFGDHINIIFFPLFHLDHRHHLPFFMVGASSLHCQRHCSSFCCLRCWIIVVAVCSLSNSIGLHCQRSLLLPGHQQPPPSLLGVAASLSTPVFFPVSRVPSSPMVTRCSGQWRKDLWRSYRL